VNALHHEIRGRILNPAVNGWATETDIPVIFRINDFHSSGFFLVYRFPSHGYLVSGKRFPFPKVP
jgi:hypothetical protein